MKWYYYSYRGEEIFFQEDKFYNKVIKYHRASVVKNRHSVIGVYEISWTSFYGRYLNWLTLRSGALFMEITRDKFQQEVKEYINKTISL